MVKEQKPLNPDDSRRQSASPAPQAQGIDWAAKRRQWNFKLLQSPAKVVKKSEKKPSENEEFLPPQMSLMEYFLRKVSWYRRPARPLKYIYQLDYELEISMR